MKKLTSYSILSVLSFFLVAGLVGSILVPAAFAAVKVNLLSTNNFAVLAGSTITNTGSSVINGDLGLSPGSAVTGFPPGVVNGSQLINNAAAVQAQADLTAAYNAAAQTPVSTIPTELGGTTKVAGTYDSAAGTFGITGTLTLDAQGDPNAVFIFKSASTLVTAGGSSVSLLNGAQACNVFWQVGSSATLGTNSTFKGNILALTSATLTTGANVEGRVLARNGAVTLDTNTITKPTCAVPATTPAPAPVVTPVVTPVVPTVTTPPATVPSNTPSVVAAAPGFPDTGYAPEGTQWNIGLVVILMSVLAAWVAISRKRSA